MDEKPFYYLYEFLKRSTAYRECCLAGGAGPLMQLYRDLGDVHKQEFNQWWQSHQHLFIDSEPRFVINDVYTKQSFCELYDDDEPNFVGIIVNLAETKKAILEEIEALVTRLQRKRLADENRLMANADPNKVPKRKRGRPKFDPSYFHRYGLAANLRAVDIDVLGKSLAVLDACLAEKERMNRGEKKRKTLYQIGDELGIAPEPSAKRLANEKYGEPERRKGVTVAVCRYKRWGEQIIANLERGVFPKHGK